MSLERLERRDAEISFAGRHPEQQYLDLLAECLTRGARVTTRSGDVRGVFGRHLRFDLTDGFPLLTTKRLHVRSIVEELFWMLRGDTNARSLQARGVSIWDEWADPDTGDLGPIYGAQWRGGSADGAWVGAGGVDQIAALIAGLRADPYGRRHLVSAWAPKALPAMALPPCHFAFQFHVTPWRRLSCQVYQRSADVFLGLPFNIASYALLTHLVAQVTGMIPADLVFALGDVHLYETHAAAAARQLERTPISPLPDVILPVRGELDDYAPEDVKVIGYEAHPHIPAEVAK